MSYKTRIHITITQVVETSVAQAVPRPEQLAHEHRESGSGSHHAPYSVFCLSLLFFNAAEFVTIIILPRPLSTAFPVGRNLSSAVQVAVNVPNHVSSEQVVK